MQHLISNYGLLAIFLLMTLESAALPIPSELVMTFGGFLASTGKLNFVAVVAAGTFGNMAGSYITWVIGRYLGRAAIIKLGKFILLKEEDLLKAEKWFERRGDFAVFFARMIPVLRTFVSLPAGAAEMPLLKFGFFTLLGSIPFNLALAAAGYALGSNYGSLVKVVQDAGYVIAIVAVVIIALFFYKRYQIRKSGATGV